MNLLAAISANDASTISMWVHNFLLDTCGLAPWLVVTIECLLIGVGLLLLYTILALFYILY